MLLTCWKAIHSLILNARKPQVYGVYNILHPRLIHQEFPTQRSQELHRLLLTPTDGLKELTHLKGVGHIDGARQRISLTHLFIGDQTFILTHLL